jgi:hypothetical protein
MTGLSHPGTVGNRFGTTWLGSVLVPLPTNYVQGIDAQKLDFERGLPSYLNGTWQDHGWWYFYLYALAIKVPIGTYVLLAVATLLTVFHRRYSADWQDEALLLVPLAALVVLVSSQDGFSIHFRYVLPVFPFAFIWLSKAARVFSRNNRPLGYFVAIATIGSFASSLCTYPHSLSYFNELVGGPRNGHLHLLDSNIAWGQDLLYLKRWYYEHEYARPFHYAAVGHVDPQITGIKFDLPVPSAAREPGSSAHPQFGWYAIDVNHLHRSPLLAPNGAGNYASVSGGGADLSYFLRLQPQARVGWSVYIYWVTREAANRAAKDSGPAAVGEPDLKH